MLQECVVLITASSLKEARHISQTLLQAKLAACVNIVPKIESQYWWKGKIEQASEVLLIVKTKRSLINLLIKKVQAIHSYTVPEMIALPIVEGNPAYLKWIGESVQGG